MDNYRRVEMKLMSHQSTKSEVTYMLVIIA